MVQSLWIYSKCIAPYTLVTHRTNAFIADLYYSFSTLVKFILKLATYSFNALNTWGTDGRNRLSSYVSFGRAILTQQPPFTQLKREMSLHQWSLTKSQIWYQYFAQQQTEEIYQYQRSLRLRASRSFEQNTVGKKDTAVAMWVQMVEERQRRIHHNPGQWMIKTILLRLVQFNLKP